MPKDACYRKVKAKYKVFPSAYASGAIAKCRKVGAANWGNKSKKKWKTNLNLIWCIAKTVKNIKQIHINNI